MGRKAKDKTFADLDLPTQRRIKQRIAEGTTASQLYRDFGLASAGLNDRTFRLFVAREKRKAGLPAGLRGPRIMKMRVEVAAASLLQAFRALTSDAMVGLIIKRMAELHNGEKA